MEGAFFVNYVKISFDNYKRFQKMDRIEQQGMVSMISPLLLTVWE
jgi:hypothetical protein